MFSLLILLVVIVDAKMDKEEPKNNGNVGSLS